MIMTVSDVLSRVEGTTTITVSKNGNIVRDFIPMFHSEDANDTSNGYRWQDVLNMSVIVITPTVVSDAEDDIETGLMLMVE